jgi:peptide/nickel transport system substrate-binding protein
MGEQSTYTKVMLTILAILVALGLYHTISAYDLLRRQQLRLENEVKDVAQAIRRRDRAADPASGAIDRLAEEQREARSELATLADTLQRLEREGLTATVVREATEDDAGEAGPEGGRPPAEDDEEAPPAPDQAERSDWSFHNSDLYDPDAVDGGVRRSAVSSLSGTMNMLLPGSDRTVSDFWDLVNDSLGSRNSATPERWEPRLAGSWRISDDGRVFEITLKKGVYWHDFTDPVTGTEYEDVPVTAHDFKFYIDTIRNPHLPTDSLRNYYKDLDDIEVIDEHHFVVRWKDAYFRAKEFTLGLQPYPRHLYRPDPETSDEEYANDLLTEKTDRNNIIVGCGPYVFAEYKTGELIRFERNEQYHGPLPPVRVRTVRLIKDEEINLIELKKGNLDLKGLTATQWVKQTDPPLFHTVVDDVERGTELSKAWDRKKKQALRDGETFGEHTFEKYLYRSFAYNFIAWNMRRPILADRRVRVALTHAIDRERIIDKVFHNLGTLITGNFVPHSLYYDHDIDPWPHDPEAAKEMLAEAGWEDTDGDGILDKDLDDDGEREPFRFTFLAIPNHPYQSRWVPMVRDDLKPIGIDMEVQLAEWAVFQKQIEEFDFDATSFYWSGGIESDPYQLWHGSQADVKKSSNIAGFDHEEANTIMETARRTLDLDKRIALYNRFHRIIHQEQPYTFLMCPHSKLAIHKRYQNVIVYPLGVSSSLMWVPAQLQREAAY